MMWKSVFYKEWLKVRWFLILFTVIGLIVIGYIFLKLKNSLAFSGANSVWATILFQGFLFFKIFKFVPLGGGLLVACAQYLPEIAVKRIKLSFHLPLGENKVLLLMQVFGTLCLFASFLIFFGLFGFLSSLYLPFEIIADSFLTILPWTLAGFSAYFIVAFIVLEPAWIYRLCYLLTGASFLSMYFIPTVMVAYRPVIIAFILLGSSLSTALLFSGYRFRKGEN